MLLSITDRYVSPTPPFLCDKQRQWFVPIQLIRPVLSLASARPFR